MKKKRWNRTQYLLVPLRTRLQLGNRIKIITSKMKADQMIIKIKLFGFNRPFRVWQRVSKSENQFQNKEKASVSFPLFSHSPHLQWNTKNMFQYCKSFSNHHFLFGYYFMFLSSTLLQYRNECKYFGRHLDVRIQMTTLELRIFLCCKSSLSNKNMFLKRDLFWLSSCALAVSHQPTNVHHKWGNQWIFYR